MRLIGMLAAGLILLASCEKEDIATTNNGDAHGNDVAKKSAAKLLTQKQWSLSTAGFDSNNNGVVDAAENILAECQQGTIYVFNPNGRGTITDVGLVCNPPELPDFTWKLQNNNQVLEMIFLHYFVLRLNENELVISPDVPLQTKFIYTFRH